MENIYQLFTSDPKAWVAQLTGIDAARRYMRSFITKTRVNRATWRFDLPMIEGEYYEIRSTSGDYDGCYEVRNGALRKCPYPRPANFRAQIESKLRAS